MRMKLRLCLVSSVSFVAQIGEFSIPILGFYARYLIFFQGMSGRFGIFMESSSADTQICELHHMWPLLRSVCGRLVLRCFGVLPRRRILTDYGVANVPVVACISPGLFPFIRFRRTPITEGFPAHGERSVLLQDVTLNILRTRVGLHRSPL